MKSFGTHVPAETVGIGFTRFAFPRGRVLPRSPVPGEMFYLEGEIDGNVQRPSFERGLYISSGYDWIPYTESFAKQKACSIGAQIIEVEIPWNMKSLPMWNQGFKIAEASIKPGFRKNTISGVASFWTSTDLDSTLFIAVYRGQTLVSFAFEELLAFKPRTVSISFIDNPSSIDDQLYTLKLNTNITGAVHVNRSRNLVFDGASSTAFIVSENN